MLVNPSIYNQTGKYTSNYDLLTLERRNGIASSKIGNPYDYPYKNSLTEQINQAKYKSISQFANNFRTDLTTVLSTVKLLSNKKSTVYDDRKAVETSKAFDVKASEGAAIGKQDLKVSQIATAQVNTSAFKPKNAVFQEDLNGQLTLSKNGKSKTLDFTLKKGETTEEGYLRLSKIINQSKIGVTAEVKTDAMGYTALQITSNETGKDAAFKLSGSLSEDLDLNSKQVDGQNMTYELNGKKGESANNQLQLEEGKVTIDVKAVNTEAETFEIKESTESLADTLKDFATAINQFVENQKDSDNPAMQAVLKQLTNTVKKSLDQMDLEGIQMDQKGHMTVDETTLSKELETKGDTVKEALTSFDGFAANLTRKTEQLLKSPLGDLTPKINSSSENRTIGDYLKTYMYNYSAQSMITNINQLNGAGSILDVRI